MNIPTGFLDSSGSVPFSLPERDQQGDDPIAQRISHNLQRLRDKRQLWFFQWATWELRQAITPLSLAPMTEGPRFWSRPG